MRLFLLFISFCWLTACQNESANPAATSKQDTSSSKINETAPTVGGVQIEEAKIEQEPREVPLPRSQVAVLQHYVALEDMLRSASSTIMLDLATQALDEQYFYVDKNFEIQQTKQPSTIRNTELSPYHPYIHQYIVAKMPDRKDYMRQVTIGVQGQANNEVLVLRFTPGERNNTAAAGWDGWKGSVDFQLSCPTEANSCNEALLKKTNRSLNSLLRRTM